MRIAALLACLAALCAQGAALDADRALAASRAAIGSQPRDFAFTDTSGKRVTLAAFRGRPLVVSLVYTACSQVCPTTTKFLSRAVREARAVVGRDAFDVVSIGFDIPSDNPMTLRLFAVQNGIDDPRWSFLTPDPGAPAELARELGFSYEPQAGGYEHLTQVTILDAQGRLYTQVYGETFAIPMLVQPLRELALGAPPANTTLAATLDRVRLLCTVYDPVNGTYRLDYALFAEMLAGFIVLGATLAFLVREQRRARRPC